MSIYLDHAATTPLRPEARDAMEPFGAEAFGNPSSTHGWGRRAAVVLEEAREVVAAALGVRASEIRFVRGGTEANNLAVLGRARAAAADGAPPLVVCSAVEHRAVLEPAEAVEREGGERVLLPVSEEGSLDLAALDRALERRPALVSVMWVNNETGTVLPVEAVADRCREAGVPFHTDAVQAVGKVPVDLERVAASLLTVTGHKLGGPKGAAALVVRDGTRLEPLLFGGGQERGLRPGTEDVAGAVGLARAVRLAVEEIESVAPRLEALRDRLSERLRDTLPGVRVHAGTGERAPHVLSLGIPDLDGEALLAALDLEGVAASGGSACSSGAHRGSHVLAALHGEEYDAATVRFSLGRTTTADEVDGAADALLRVIGRMRGVEAEASARPEPGGRARPGELADPAAAPATEVRP